MPKVTGRVGRAPGRPTGQAEEATSKPQPRRSRRQVDDGRRFDKTSCRESQYGDTVHRDYAAHFFRWGFAGRFINNETDVLDVGCGVDCPLARALNFPRTRRPASYVGVDLNGQPPRVPGDAWARFLWGFDFTSRHVELGEFDVVTCLEVLEHMGEADGLALLGGLAACLRGGGTLLLSTPVFNGSAAANHVHEWRVADLAAALEGAGLSVEARYGTFASWDDVKRVASPEHVRLLSKLSAYYSHEVLSCFVAPLYPDASRNNVWVCRPTA